jgi:hypothetical protein
MRKTISRGVFGILCGVASAVLMYYGQTIPALGCAIAFFCLTD